MDLAAWGGVLGGVAGIIGGVVAVWQAFSASGARKEAQQAGREAAASAKEANVLAERVVVAQEDIAKYSRPHAWSDVHAGSGGLRWFRNTSKRDIVLESVVVTPESASALVQIDADLPRMIRKGEIIEMTVEHRLSLSPRHLTFYWRFDEEEEVHDSVRVL